MGRKEDIAASRAADAKLRAYCQGLPRGSAETSKYRELNAKANDAAKKLPWYLR